LIFGKIIENDFYETKHFLYETSFIISLEALTLGGFVGEFLVTLDLISSYIFERSELLLFDLFELLAFF
jgi:hypothetical protein